MSENIFSAKETDWLRRHPEIEDSFNESLEDSLNVNPLDNGELDLIPYHRAAKAAHITIEVAEKKLIAGPYDNVHWQIVRNHLNNYPSLIDKEKTFWEIFSFECASSKEEDDTRAKERIYMEAMKEMIRMIDEGVFELLEGGDQVAKLNTNTIRQIKGRGVNAKFVD